MTDAECREEFRRFLREVGISPLALAEPLDTTNPEYRRLDERLRQWIAAKPGRREWLGLPPDGDALPEEEAR